MKYLQTEAYIGNNECSGDAIEPAKLAALRADELSEQIDSLAPGTAVNDRLRLVLDRCYVLLELNRF